MSERGKSLGPQESAFKRQVQLSHLVDALDVSAQSPLGIKARRIVEGIITIWNHNGGYFVRDDATAIQSLVLHELSPSDYKEIAKLSFANWATADRLAGPGLPHLNRINQRLGKKVAFLAKRDKKNQIRILDLGAGLLHTTQSIVQAVAPLGCHIEVTAVDATSALMQAAKVRREQLLHTFPQVEITLYLGDMLEFLRSLLSRSVDYITISFAIHHLHPTEQSELIQEAWRVLRVPGAFLLADPQEGKSDFNLKTLIYEEPEAIFAAFTSPDSMRRLLQKVGFSPVRVLLRDDIGFEGYAVCGEKLRDNTDATGRNDR